jgi:hypothetical protein
VLGAACQDLQIPGGDQLTGADLIVLPLQAGTPAPGVVTFYAVNSRTVARTLRHPDNVLTVFAEVEFPTGSLASLDGVTLGPGDSVQVTVAPDPGVYGINVSPSGLAFSAAARPSVTFSYARYGDATAGLASSRYSTAADYAAALDVWREVGLDLWSVATGSAATGGDGVTARMSGAGGYVAAAPR